LLIAIPFISGLALRASSRASEAYRKKMFAGRLGGGGG